MIYTDKTKRAMKLCFKAHAGQVDKSGLPYVHHALFVSPCSIVIFASYHHLAITKSIIKILKMGHIITFPAKKNDFPAITRSALSVILFISKMVLKFSGGVIVYGNN